ncbi:McrC family protein [Alteromonas ponticola]|uniref:McrC family protein n=1 Tax=Alteromonas ponticola TaxID=2720613 RepID=A0ABX1R5G9_9ALTE|nr:McrC family protein [Alteromonas ponticola]NMH61013.1 McrC family protein [Alteromonas ponticola]
MERFIQVFEFGYICSGENTGFKDNVSVVPESAYRFLRLLSLDDSQHSQILRLKSLGGCEVLQFQNYVGVLITPDGFQIEILPKVAKLTEHENGLVESRLALLNMLRSLGEFRHIQSNLANVMEQKMPLLEVFVAQFLSSVNTVVKRGIKRDYINKFDNLFYLKGKLQVADQLKRNLIQRQKFCVEYDEFKPDIPANRLIKGALQKVLSFTRSQQNQRLARELEFAFNDVGKLTSYDYSEALHTGVNRGMEYYKPAVAWAEMVLRGVSPLSMQGRANAFSLLFPLESIFESYVERVLQIILPAFMNVKGQLQTTYLVHFNTQRMFKLKPDIAVYQNEKLVFVMDTKWKLIDASKNNGSDKFMLAQADLYQMFAYGHKYLKGSGDLILIYPMNSKFKEPLPYSFKYSDDLRLWIVPFDVHHQTQDESRIKWPQPLKSKLLLPQVELHSLI